MQPAQNALNEKPNGERPSSSEISQAFTVGVLGGLVGQYAGNVTTNILEKRPLDKIFIPNVGAAYYANVAAGSVGAILSLFIHNTDLFITLAVILNQIFIDLFLRLENKPGYQGDKLVYAIIRNTVVLIIVLKSMGLVDGKSTKIPSEEETRDFDEFLQEALIIGTVVNSTISFLNHFVSLEDWKRLCLR